MNRGAVRSEVLGYAVGALPFLVAFDVVLMRSAWLPLDRHWPTTIEELNGSWPVLYPLTAAIAAAVLVPYYAPASRELTVVLPGRGVRVLLVRAGGVAALVALEHLLVTAAVLAWATTRGARPTGELWGLLPALGGIVAMTGVGVLAAAVRPTWWTPPVVLVGGYVVLWRADDHLPGSLFHPGGAEGLLYGQGYRPGVALIQLVGGIALAVLLVVLAAGTWRRLAVPPAVLVGLAALVAASAALLGPVGDRPYREVPVAWRCLGESPRLCFVREEADKLPTARPRLVAAIAALRTVGVPLDPPDTFREAVGGDFRRDDGDGTFNPTFNDPVNAVTQVLESMSSCYDERGETADIAERYAVADPADTEPRPSRAEAQLALRTVLECR